MAHKSSHGDKLFYGGKGCEVGADPPVCPSQKGFCKYAITDELSATRFAYEGLWLLAAN